MSLAVRKSIKELSDWEIVQLVRRIREDLNKLEILVLKRERRGRRILEIHYNGKISYNKALRRLQE